MATAHDLFESSDLFFAELQCPTDDPEWGEHNVVTHPIVALPVTPVWQVHDGAPRSLMTANHAVFHHAGSEYHREPFRGSAYRCLFFFPDEALVREMAEEIDPSVGVAEAIRFPASSAPLDARTFALARRLATRLTSGRADALQAREGLYAVLRSVVRSAFRSPAARSRARRRTAAAHAEIAEEAKELIAGSLGARVGLDALAARLYVSPYHLARVFRAATGYSLHAYRTHLRLREGLDRLEREPRRQVGLVGTDLGFRTHSHFTAAFHRTLGLQPSEVEPSTISTA